MTDLAALRRQLDIPRDQARALGAEAVRILERGGYEAPDGAWVDLRAAIDAAVAGTVEYGPGSDPPAAASAGRDTAVEVVNEPTLAAAARLAAGGRVAALNFASAREPGGGFLRGARAQEEYLARSSGLYACLRDQGMYRYHAANLDPMYADFVLWSPDVPVFRGEDHRLLERPWACSVLTSPAPLAKQIRRFEPARLPDVAPCIERRLRKVLAVARARGADALVLGAWGCGAFGNDGDQVAGLFRAALEGEFRGAFSRVAFAVTDWSDSERFIGPFRRAFG